MSFSYSVSRLFEIFGSGARAEGEYTGQISGIASLAEAGPGDLSFLGNPKYKPEVAGCRASVLLLPEDFEGRPATGQLFIRLPKPSFALALLCRDIEKSLFPAPAPGIHPAAVVESGAVVDPSASVGPFCLIRSGARIGPEVVLESSAVIGREATVGAQSWLFPGVVVGDFCEIGPRNRLSAGSVIGADGYGYEFTDGAHQRVPQIGRVVTGADVDIGANTTIDRARFGATVVGRGTKIDNQVQVGHNVRIGEHCLLVAQVGISGSTTIGNGVVIAGQVGLAGHLNIGDGCIIAAASGVSRSLEPGEKVQGTPVEPLMLAQRISILKRRLPELFKRFGDLEKKVESLCQASQPCD